MRCLTAALSFDGTHRTGEFGNDTENGPRTSRNARLLSIQPRYAPRVTCGAEPLRAEKPHENAEGHDEPEKESTYRQKAEGADDAKGADDANSARAHVSCRGSQSP